jgi:carbonic anhydrase
MLKTMKNSKHSFSILMTAAVSAILTLSACSSITTKREEPRSQAPAEIAKAPIEAKTSADIAQNLINKQPVTQPIANAAPAPQPPIEVAKAPVEAAPPAEVAHAPAEVAKVPEKATEHHKVEGVEPDKALKWLVNGNKRFTTGQVRRDGQSKKDIARLSSGQKPHTIVLSCSDSRVPPEIAFDQKLGEIFVVRTAGEALNDNAVGSIEYALAHLGSRLIVVLGHNSCGAVKAAHSTLGGADAGSPALNNLVKDIHPRISSFAGKTPSTHFNDESWANAKGVAKDLMVRSDIIRNAITSGEVKIVSALYDLESGKVAFDQ